jgi:dCTP deaminase
MRLCDRDIEAWLDEGRLSSIRARPLSVLTARRSMFGWGINFALSRPHGALYRPERAKGGSQRGAGSGDERRDRAAGRRSLLLHPGELALAVTYESVTCRRSGRWLDGRSSLARLG